MSLELEIETLRTCTERVGLLQDPGETIDEGLLLLTAVSTDSKLAESVEERISGFAEALLQAKAAYLELADLITTKNKSHLEILGELKQWIEEWQTQPVLAEFQRYSETLLIIDEKLASTEEAFSRLETFNQILADECRRFRRAKSTAGGVLMASGCMALALSAAALIFKYTAQKTGQTLSPATALLLRFSPWNTALTGGVIAVLGARDTRKSLNYTKLALDIEALAGDIENQVRNWRSYRTNVQRLRHAVDDVVGGLNVGSGLGSINASSWGALLTWLPVQETYLTQQHIPPTDNNP